MDASKLLNIASEYGTPLYVYDAELIRKQYHELQEAFSGFSHQIHYAMKANENPEILKIIKNLGGGIDAVSPNEIRRALAVGFTKEEIVFTPSCPDFDELSFAFDQGIHVHIGATEYLPFILKNYPDVKIGLRINPGNAIEGNQKIATAHNNSKFGIPINQIDQILDFVGQGLQVDSLHLHTGSDVKSWQDLARSVDAIFDFSKHFSKLKYIDLGSGFKVKYHKTDPDIDLKSYAGYIENKLKTISNPLTIKFEPGKFLVSEAGVLLVKANVVKQGYSKKFVGVNSGFHHLIRPMYYDAYHKIINLSNPSGTTEKYDVVGQLCEEDTFAYDRDLPQVRMGDILAILNAGAYGFSLSSDYNMRDKPKQILVDKDMIKLI